VTTAAVVGVTGYAGAELAWLLLRHPRLQRLTCYLRDGQPVRCLSELYPEWRGVVEAPCRPLSVPAVIEEKPEVVFLATPAEVSAQLAPELVEAGLRVVDLSGAFRLGGIEQARRWYGLDGPAARLLGEAVYGLPELGVRLDGARLVANPGCYPTAVLLGLQPLLEAGWVDLDRGIVCDAKSGVSGAGRQPRPETHFVEVNENFRAYGLFAHRHEPEILGRLKLPDPAQFIFTTHLLPLERGLLATLYLWLRPPRPAAEVEQLFRSYYAGRPLIRIWPAGTVPSVRHVVRTNFCDLGVVTDAEGRRLVVVSCLDNLGKGAAGQAVQNMNLMLGYSEDEGLR